MGSPELVARWTVIQDIGPIIERAVFVLGSRRIVIYDAGPERRAEKIVFETCLGGCIMLQAQKEESECRLRLRIH